MMRYENFMNPDYWEMHEDEYEMITAGYDEEMF